MKRTSASRCLIRTSASLPSPRRRVFLEATAAAAAIGLLAVVPSHAQTVENIQIGSHLDGPPANLPAQAEPHLSRSWSDPGLFLAAFQDGRYTDGGAWTCDYALSHDGGAHWQRDFIPGLQKAIGTGQYARATDPVTAISSDNTLYLSALGLNPDPNSGELISDILLLVSTDLGATFSNPIVVLKGTSGALLDKNWLTVDPHPNSPHPGRIAITFTHFKTDDLGRQVSPIMALFSDDRGKHWTTPIQISPVSCQGSQPYFFSDGTFGCVYFNFTTSTYGSAYSSDGGNTFTNTQATARISYHRDGIARDAYFLGSAVCAPLTDTLYLVYQARISDVPRVFFSRSTDRGATWSPTIAISDNPVTASIFNPNITTSFDGQHLMVAYYDKRNDDGSRNFYDLYLLESFDAGTTWNPARRVSQSSSDLRQAPMTSTGRMVGDYHAVVPSLTPGDHGGVIRVDTRLGAPAPFFAPLTRSQGSRWETWSQLVFTAKELADPAVSAKDADPDHDGRPNFLEYLEGTLPKVAERPPWVASLVQGQATQLFGIRDVRSPWTFDALHAWESSQDLVSWHVGPAPVSETRGPTILHGGFFTIEAGFGVEPGTSLFVRPGATWATP